MPARMALALADAVPETMTRELGVEGGVGVAGGAGVVGPGVGSAPKTVEVLMETAGAVKA